MSFHIKNLKDNERPKPRLWLAKPDKTIIERLDGIEELNGTFNFMNQNELTFNVNAFLYDEIKNEQVKNPAIHLVKNKYLLKFTYLNQEKWFVIDSKGEVSEEKDYIPVVAKHIGSELDGKYIGDIEEIGVTPSQIINKYLAIVAPNWKLANIDEKIVDVKRTYELSNASISNLLESVTELTDSVIKFHDKEREFSLIHNDNAGQFKGLKVKEETYLKGYSDSKDSTNLVTRLVLFGKDNMTINSVNPAGTSYIEDFSFYMKPFKRDAQRNVISHSDYLSDELCHALLDYQDYFENKREEYEEVTESYGNLLTEQLEEEFKLMEYEGVLQRLEDRIELLKPHGAYRELTVSSSRNIALDYATYYMILVENRGSLARIKFNNQEHFIQPNSYEYIKVRTPEGVEVGEDSDSYLFEVLSANTDLRLAISTSSENDFEEEDTEILDERYNLNKYKSLVQEQRAVVATIQRRLTALNNNRLSINHSLLPSVFFTPKLLEERENFVHWGVYTEENHTVPEELLQDGLTQLAEKNNVERQIEAQLIDFLQSLEPEDRENWDKLTAGDIILFSNKTYDANMQAFISELRINFDAHEIDLTISDIIDFRSKQSGIAKRLAAFASTASQVNLHRTQLSNAEGKINEVTRLLEGEWDANLRRISAANETVSIDNRGLVIQSPTHPNEMLVAVAGVIAISDDYGVTFKQAINTRGVVAEQIIGKLLIGNDLILENDSGKVRFDNDGLRINADSFHLVSDDGENYFDTLLARIGADIVSVEETIKEQIENQRESLIGEIGDLDSALTDYTSTLINALADGMLTEQEILKLQLQLNMLEVEYQQVEKRVVRVIQDVYVDPVIQENLYFRYKELESMYTKLVTFIRNLDEPIEVPQETIENIIDLISQFKPTLVELVGAIEEALENSQITQIFNAEYHSMEYADKLSDDLEDEIRDLNEAMELFEGVFDEALSDGILTMLEKNSMSDAMLRLRSEKRDIDNRYLLIYNHPQLSENTSVKQNLSNAKSAYDSSFVLLEEKVELLLTLDKVTVEQVEEYKTRYEAFADEIVNYQETYELALEAIQMSYVDDAEGRAKEYADGLRIEIQADIEDVEANLTAFETEVNGAYRDGIITEQEKRRLDIHMEMLGKEKGDVIERYNTIITSPDLQGYYDIQPLVNARQAYGDIHASLILSIQTAMLDNKITKEEGNEATRLFDEYADALANFSSELELAVAALGEVKAVRFTEGELEGYVTSIFLGQQLEEIKAQVDGHIKTYYYDYVPTMNNIPASEWTTTEDKEKHVGDLFYNNETGVAYRFTKQGSTFGWVEIKDNEVTKALKDAQDALDLADNKRRVFVVTPIPPYDVGDLWIRNDGELMRARTAKDENGNYSVSDWIVATKYTDDTKANAVENALTAYKTSNNKEIQDLKTSLTAFQGTVEGAFRDGIIEEYELKIIESNINALSREKADVDAGYNQLINHDKITGNRRTRLQTTYQAFQSTHQELIDAINAAVLDGKISENEMSQINALFEDYPVKLKAYKDEMNDAYLYLIKSADDKAQDLADKLRIDTWQTTTFEQEAGRIASRVGSAKWEEEWKPAAEGITGDAISDYNTNVIESNYSTREQTAKEITDAVTGINLEAYLENIGSGRGEVSVSTNSPKSLTHIDGSALDDSYSYEIVARRVNESDTPTQFVAVFESKGKGQGWERHILDQKGSTSSHPELYVSDREIKLRTYNTGNTVYAMEYVYVKYAGDFTSVSWTKSEIQQTDEAIRQTVTESVKGENLISSINQTASSIVIDAQFLGISGSTIDIGNNPAIKDATDPDNIVRAINRSNVNIIADRLTIDASKIDITMTHGYEDGVVKKIENISVGAVNMANWTDVTPQNRDRMSARGSGTETITIISTQGEDFIQARNAGSAAEGTVIGMNMGRASSTNHSYFQIEKGQEYVLTLRGSHSTTVDNFSYMFLMRDDSIDGNTSNQGISGAFIDRENVETGYGFRYTWKFTANWSSRQAYLLVGTHRNGSSLGSAAWFRIREIQLEKGNKPSDWRPSLKDEQERVSESISSLENQVNENISSVESSLDTKMDAAEVNSELSGLRSALQTTTSHVEVARTDLQNMHNRTVGWEENLGELSNRTNFVDTYIKESNEGILIANTTEDTGVHIGYNSINFIQGGEPVAWIENQNLYFKRGIFSDTIMIGDPNVGGHAFQSMSKDRTIVTWVNN